MEFHISRDARQRYGVNELLFNYVGNVVFANLAASRELANRITQVRGTTVPSQVVHAGALFAMGLIDELSHALVAQYRKTLDPEVLAAALRWFESHQNQAEVTKLLRTFTDLYPNTAIFRGEQTVDEWLNQTVDGKPNRESALEELLLLWLANINPAFRPFKELFDDQPLQQRTIYRNVTAEFGDYFATRPPFSPEAGTLLDVLRAPMLAAPDSLAGQLEYIREKWSDYLGDDLRRLLLAIDILKEEDIAIWMLFHPPSAAQHHGDRMGKWLAQGFVGDEFVGFHARGSKEAVVHEYEAFSPDQAWMPTVVLIAKSTYVWLEQLSKKYQRHIHRLDQIPDEELALLAGRGLNALWLIGLWERSIASQTIKRLRGQADAVASAYSLRDYRIAEDLGGAAAYATLRDRAAAAGIRLASDMVPNHMGIDSNWLIEHPEWFLSRWDIPYPSYSFEGPDLSSDSRVEIKIEDHYYDQTDAAVVFRRRDRSTGRTEYVYHGNDGTSFPWNDTAQLDYSKAVVREQVIQTILQVARQFPIIRFDAAMTLAKKHVQRLWFPLPGSGGAIPSRAEFSMTQEEFDGLMPNEFWREVVDRVAAEVPGTLLLAEAFWLLEGYFVRTLGMHRVYNSAFMNMLRDEENAKYRSVLKKTIDFDPDILKRYVNFMSNPDERTAIDQFGTGDKYFGVCTLMATLPGLPMFGHGQIEAFTEKYGMEYKRARYDETPNEDLIARHQREIAPLLKNRRLFAESENFALYDFWTESGTVDENVFAYSNRLHDERAIVLFNNRYNHTRGTIHVSLPSVDKPTGTLRQTRLSDALRLPSDSAVILACEDTAAGLKYLHRPTALDHHGLTFELHAYQYAVLLHWRELRSTAEQPWEQLCDTLNGRGVRDLDEALAKLRFKAVHDALRDLLSAALIEPLIEIAEHEVSKPKQKLGAKASTEKKPSTETYPDWAEFSERADIFFTRVDEICGPARKKPGFPETLSQKLDKRCQEQWAESMQTILRLPQLESSFAQGWPVAARIMLPSNSPVTRAIIVWAPVLAWSAVRCISVQGAELFDQLHLRSALAEIFSALGLEGEGAWRAAARIRLLLLQNYSELQSFDQSEKFWSDPDIKWLTGVNESGGIAYFNKEQFEELMWWLQLPELIKTAQDETTNLKAWEKIEERVASAAHRARQAGYQVKKYLALHEAKPPQEETKASRAENADLTEAHDLEAEEETGQPLK